MSLSVLNPLASVVRIQLKEYEIDVTGYADELDLARCEVRPSGAAKFTRIDPGSGPNSSPRNRREHRNIQHRQPIPLQAATGTRSQPARSHRVAPERNPARFPNVVSRAGRPSQT